MSLRVVMVKLLTAYLAFRGVAPVSYTHLDAASLKAATPIGKGLGASPGAACGKVVFTADDAATWAEKGEKVVLVRLETSPEDITGMKDVYKRQ